MELDALKSSKTEGSREQVGEVIEMETQVFVRILACFSTIAMYSNLALAGF